MVHARYFLLVIAVAVGSTGQAWANMGPPPQRSGTPLSVTVDRNLAQTRLVIPKNLLPSPAQIRLDAGATPGQQGGGDLRSRTITAGVVLSLLLAGGGAVTVLARRKRGRTTITASIGVLVVLGVWAGVGYADLPPYGRTQQFVRPPSPGYGFLSNVDIQTVERGDQVILIIGRDLVGSFAAVDTPTAQTMGKVKGEGGFGAFPPQ